MTDTTENIFLRDTMCRSLLIIHGSRVSAVVKPSCITYTLWFCARCFLTLMYRTYGMLVLQEQKSAILRKAFAVKQMSLKNVQSNT